MIARSWPSRAASASCACFRSVMSWPTTYSPLTVPSKLQVGHAARADPALAAVGVDDRALVGDRLARERAVALGLQHAGEASGPPTSSVVLPTTSSRARPTRCRNASLTNCVAAVLGQVDDRLGDVVVEQAQLLLARGERLLGELEVVDVVLGAVQAAHRARRVEVGRDAAVQPAPLPCSVLPMRSYSTCSPACARFRIGRRNDATSDAITSNGVLP